MSETFRPGIYRHYKGGLYRALFLAKEEGRSKGPAGSFWVVVYVSLSHGTVWTRPLRSLGIPDQDAWTDLVTWTEPNGFATKRHRFEYVGEEVEVG